MQANIHMVVREYVGRRPLLPRAEAVTVKDADHVVLKDGSGGEVYVFVTDPDVATQCSLAFADLTKKMLARRIVDVSPLVETDDIDNDQEVTS